MFVHDVLKAKRQRVISIGPEKSVRQALACFVKHNIGSLPVVDDLGRVVGIFSERDVVFGDHRDSERFHQRPIGEVMTRDPIICSPTDTLAVAMGKMARHHVGQLPVVRRRRIGGVGFRR